MAMALQSERDRPVSSVTGWEEVVPVNVDFE